MARRRISIGKGVEREVGKERIKKGFKNRERFNGNGIPAGFLKICVRKVRA